MRRKCKKNLLVFNDFIGKNITLRFRRFFKRYIILPSWGAADFHLLLRANADRQKG